MYRGYKSVKRKEAAMRQAVDVFIKSTIGAIICMSQFFLFVHCNVSNTILLLISTIVTLIGLLCLSVAILTICHLVDVSGEPIIRKALPTKDGGTK